MLQALRHASPPAVLVRPRTPVQSPSTWHDEHDQEQFETMVVAFRRSGGVVTGDELALLLRSRHEQPVSLVARWVVRRTILHFTGRGQTLIPLFQFDPETMLPRANLTCIVRELVDAFDDRELGLWFARPNSWLEGAIPVDAFRTEPAAVLRAAQADRFIALG